MTRPAEKALSEVLQELQYEVWAEDLVPRPVSAAPAEIYALLRILPRYLRGIIDQLKWRVSAWSTAVTNLWHAALFGEAGRVRAVRSKDVTPLSSDLYDIQVTDHNRRVVRERIEEVKKGRAGEASDLERGHMDDKLEKLNQQYRQYTDELISLLRQRIEAVRGRLATDPSETTRKLLEEYLVRLTTMLSKLGGDKADK